MTDRKMMEELYKLGVQHKNFVNGDHVDLTTNIRMYTSGLHENRSISGRYFSFKAFGFEVTHDTIGGMDLEANTMENFSQFKFGVWAKKIEQELQEELKTDEIITVNGKKYKLMKEAI